MPHRSLLLRLLRRPIRSSLGRGAFASLAAFLLLSAALAGPASALPEGPSAAGTPETPAAAAAVTPGEESDWAATTAADVVPPGYLQLEAGFVYEGHSPETRYALEVPVAIRLGIVSPVEARVGLGAFEAFRDGEGKSEHGVGDTVVSLKARLTPQVGLIPAIALEPFSKAPTADEEKGLGSGEWNFGVRILATEYWVPDVLYADLIVQCAWLGEPDSRSRSFFYQTSGSVLLGYDGLEPATLYAAVSWAAPEARHEPDSVVFSGGIFLFAMHSLAFDAGVDIGLGEADADWGVYGAVLWLTGPLWRW